MKIDEKARPLVKFQHKLLHREKKGGKYHGFSCIWNCFASSHHWSSTPLQGVWFSGKVLTHPFYYHRNSDESYLRRTGRF